MLTTSPYLRYAQNRQYDAGPLQMAGLPQLPPTPMGGGGGGGGGQNPPPAPPPAPTPDPTKRPNAGGRDMMYASTKQQLQQALNNWLKISSGGGVHGVMGIPDIKWPRGNGGGGGSGTPPSTDPPEQHPRLADGGLASIAMQKLGGGSVTGSSPNGWTDPGFSLRPDQLPPFRPAPGPGQLPGGKTNWPGIEHPGGGGGSVIGYPSVGGSVTYNPNGGVIGGSANPGRGNGHGRPSMGQMPWDRSGSGGRARGFDR